MTEESAVKVCVRVRPLIEREESASAENAPPAQLYWKADKKSIHQIDDGASTKSFSFDRVFAADESTKQLYQNIAKPLVVSTVGGYNGTIFAYGQTSSGKTFTMMGSELIPGVIPLAVEDVFETIKTYPKKEFLLRVSYMEIYNETVTDLLVDSWKRKPLEVRETINKNIYVADLTEELVTSPAQALAWIRKGEKNRHYGKTKMNQRSSRSHTIFRMILESRELSDPASGENADGAIIVSHLNLVDLAGSERASQTGAEGTRFKEGCNINRSLFTLGQVIKKLTDEGQRGFTNYRDSKLTRILQNSLGGNAKTVIICTITPVALDETLSTLQFASTAKKMKNDPHVTEVSDDGALLKRYRNEIADLKRRLHELQVSPVTQTTGEEKDVISQLLQEKDQLQREQEDRIKNLTKLLVTGSNLLVSRMPKRRVTWGGKMLRLAQASGGDEFRSDLSFAESFSRKRKADRSCLTILGEDDEDFEAQWEIQDEPTDDMETSQAFVTTRSFGDSPGEFITPDRMHELSGKVSNLETLLEMEVQQKEQAVAKAETLDGRVAELELRLETEAEQRREAEEATERRAAELDLQLQDQAQQRQEAVEKAEMLEIRMADLEEQLGERSQTQSNADDQMRRDLEETMQLCMNLSSEKDMVVMERDYMKQELEAFMEQTERLEKEKAALSKELVEKKEMEEFKCLEEEFNMEHQSEMQSEISSLKKILESSELRCLELQKNLEAVTEELKKKSELLEDLQKMSGKDLVQEVATLRRSLDDAEGVSRDTKKEWAFLRSRNIALEETHVTLTTDHDKMEAQVSVLQRQQEAEKTRYRKMQSDLQRELNAAFEENTKLISLLDGKVPKSVMDSLDLERTVSSLNRDLAACREAEGSSRAQLAALQDLPEQLEQLKKQVSELTEELSAAQSQRDTLLSSQVERQQESEQLRDALQASQQEALQLQEEVQAASLRGDQLSLQSDEASEQLDLLRSDLERSNAESGRLSASIQETQASLSETERQRASLEKDLSELQEKLCDSEVSRATEEEISTELQEELKQLREELQSVRAERDALSSAEEKQEPLCAEITEREQLRTELQEREQRLEQLTEELEQLREQLQSVQAERDALSERAAKAQSSAEETQTLLCTVSAERDQLKTDMGENVEIMIQIQGQLMGALEKSRAQKERIKQLEKQMVERADSQETQALQVEQLHSQVETLTEELQSRRAERDELTERAMDAQTCEEMEKLQSRATALTEERDELQEILEGLRQEKKQLRAELEERMEMEMVQTGLDQHQGLDSELREHHQQTSELQRQVEQLNVALHEASEQKNLLEAELQGNMEMKEKNAELQRLNQERQEQREQQAAETQNLLQSLSEELQQQKHLNSELENRSQQRESESERQMEELQSLRAERDGLLDRPQSVPEETEELMSRVASLSQERDELQETHETLRQERDKLQETHETLRQERDKLRAELEERTATLQEEVQRLTSELESARAQRDSLHSEEKTCEETEKLLSRVTSLSEEREQLQEILEGLRQEKKQLRAELEERMERQAERTELLSSLQSVTEQKKQLGEQLQQNVDMASSAEGLLKAAQEELEERKHAISALENQSEDRERSLRQQLRTLTEELQSVAAERDALLSEKEAGVHTSTEEREQLLARATALSEEREQLQEILEGLRQEKKQLRAELEERTETQQAEVTELHSSLQSVTQQKNQLEINLQQNMEMAANTQHLLKAAEEKLQEQKQKTCELEKLNEEKERSVEQQVSMLEEKLKDAEAHRDTLLCEKSSAEETETLLSRVTSLCEERKQLQEILEGLRQERNQLRAELEERTEMISAIQEKLNQQEADRSRLEVQLQQEIHDLKVQQANSDEENVHLQGDLKDKMETVEQLEEELQTVRQSRTHAKDEAEASQQLLSESNAAITALREQSRLDQSCSARKEVKARELSSRLQESTQKLQESFGEFQSFMNICSKYNAEAMKKSFSPGALPAHLQSCSNMSLYRSVCQAQLQSVLSIGSIPGHLQQRAQEYRDLLEELVTKDLAVFEERRLQDVLLCRAQAPSLSVKEEDLQAVWGLRLSQLLDQRQLYLQKMDASLAKLRVDMTSFPNHLSVEITERERFKEQLRVASMGEMEGVLRYELNRRATLANSREMTLQGIRSEHKRLSEELKLLQSQSDARLREEKSNRAALLQTLEDVSPRSELDLLKDNQQLVLQLQRSEEELKALCVQISQLEEAETKANSRVSNHKQATQLLQTELEDTRARVKERESAIQSLKSKLRHSESAAQMETLQAKVLKMEVELTSASSGHQQEILELNSLLSSKEESVRKLKEAIRKSQQEGDESILQGEDLHARLTHPRGAVIQSSVHLEKNKLEEEVKQLRAKINQQETSASGHQAEIAKWKSRALKLKGRNKGDGDRPLSPCTPTKRGLPLSADPHNILSPPKRFLSTPRKLLDSPRKLLDSPRKLLDSPRKLLDSPRKLLDSPRKLLDSPRRLLDSPKVALPGSPKSRFFGAGAEMLSMNCPKQFFDNSNLGMLPGERALTFTCTDLCLLSHVT
ncbi:centromere-associated protein E [Genypterus blacodes]|uniref:centromere-associated protein E n=1 Tax=Genypterus blacodes TaxID=154954 RepID=UPI003F75AAA0